MATPTKTIKIALQPIFTDGKVSSIEGRTILSIPSVPAGQCIVGLYTKHGPVPTQAYEKIAAEDESGTLNVTWEDVKNVRKWHADRDTVGEIIIQWEAFPRVVTSKTTAGPRTDTRLDQGGIQSCIFSTTPIPWGESEVSKDTYRKIIEWDIGAAPPGTRAVSSYGEGPEALERTGSLADILRLFLFVGPVLSYPPAGELSKNPHFGYYWFGSSTPHRISSLGPFLADLFLKMSDLFQDPPSETNGYRVFVRCASPAQAHGGAGGERSFLLEYNDSLPTMSPDGVMYLLSHEMVHNWPVLESNPFGTSPDDLVAWFNEGIADYYGSALPHRFGLASKASYVDQVNSLLTAYYTNPLRDISDKECMERKWETGNALEVPYKRGFAFFCWLSHEMKRSGSGKSLDDIVIEICKRKKNQEPYGLPAVKTILKDINPSVLQALEDMQNGKLVLPPSDSLGPDFELVKEPQEPFELGFSEDSISSRVVTGLVDGRRAKEAGLQEGDEILKNTFLWQCRQRMDQKMILKLKRDGKEMEITYWPRSLEKVDSWQFREKQAA